VFKVLEHEIINCPEDSSDEEDDNHEAKIRYIAQSEIQKIVS
jgi:hypothetical protein